MQENKNLTERTDEKLEQALSLAQNTIYKQYLSELGSYELVPPSQVLLDETPENCIRMYHLEELSCKKGEDVFQKLSTVYHASMSLGCNLIVMVDVDAPNAPAKIYVGVKQSDQTENHANILTTSYTTLRNGILSNFPGSKLRKINAKEDLPKLIDEIFGDHVNHVSAVSCIASVRDKSKTENKSFIQGLERLVDTMRGNTYTALLVAEPISAEKQMAIRNGYENMYSLLSTFAKTNISMNESTSESTMRTITNSVTESVTDSVSKTRGKTHGGSGGISFIASLNYSGSSSKSETQQTGTQKGTAKSTGESQGSQKTTGKTIQIEAINKQANEMLARIEEQLKRIKQCEDYGAYSCSAYFLSSRKDSCLLAANTYRALMLGDGSSVESGAINTWSSYLRDSNAKDLVPSLKEYLKRFEHPEFVKKLSGTDTEVEIPYTPGTVVSGIELPLHLGLPTRSVFGLPVIEHAEFGRNINLRERNDDSKQSSVELGTIYHMGNTESAAVSLDVKSLAMHTFVTGSTGSGKSNTVYQILQELNKQGVKFLVVEPAKGEYKHVFGNGVAKVYGTNPYYTPLLKINPFKFPKEIHVLEHIDRLIEIFNVCWPMYAAMPAVLKDSVERAYIATGWDLSTSRNKYNNDFYPTFVDVLDELNAVVAESAFSQEVKDNYVGSLATRIKSLTNGIYGRIFDNAELGDETLFDENIIVDLSRVGSVETKSMIMGILVMRLQEYRMTSGKMNADLQHVTVLEEAHNLLKRTSTEQSSESSNLLGKSVEMLANTIAEVRTYGEGFIIADQAPGLLDLSVIRNTNTKIIMRLPEEEDRILVGRAANINDEQIKELSKLPTGVAAIYQNNWIEPVLCKINKAQDDSSKKKYEYQASQLQTDMEAGAEALTPLVRFLLYSRLPDDFAFDTDDLKDALSKSSISTRNKIRLMSYISEYEKTKTLRLWDDDRFDEMSRFVTQLFGSEKAVESFVKTSNTFDELSNNLFGYIQTRLYESYDSLDLALSQCFMKNFSLAEPDNVSIYAAWRDDVVQKGGLV